MEYLRKFNVLVNQIYFWVDFNIRIKFDSADILQPFYTVKMTFAGFFIKFDVN